MKSRKYVRLREYDYSQNGYYFITICTRDKKCILWNNQKPYNEENAYKTDTFNVGATCGRPYELSRIGKIAEEEIKHFDTVYPNIYIDRYVIMPNHIHMIIVIDNPISGRPQVAPTSNAVTIPRIIKQFKGVITKKAGCSIWQKSYYDTIIRNKEMYKAVTEYIDTNPTKWALDEYYKEE